jgi:aryl-alcohol dehydrogenase-like predicted oxidoreductase
MEERRFGRTEWRVSEVGFGMWGMGGDWKGSDDTEARAALDRAVELDCNFFDTAWVYGHGHSERLLGELVRRHPDVRLFVASKIPPKNLSYPSPRGAPLEEAFPPDHIRTYTERSLDNLGTDAIDLMQFHVWEDEWASDASWIEATRSLTEQGLVRAWGVSVNRWEPDNVLETLRTGAIDAVQVVYNIFDQSPEDALFPLCEELDVAVIARVPFDEGSLTGTLTKDSTWPEGDWRNTYFSRENLDATVDRVAALRPLVPRGMTMAELALRFVLAHRAVSTVIPGMRRVANVEANMRAGDGAGLPEELRSRLREHRWDRRLER